MTEALGRVGAESRGCAQAKHVEVLQEKYHIYCTTNGRFSMAGTHTAPSMRYCLACVRTAQRAAVS